MLPRRMFVRMLGMIPFVGMKSAKVEGNEEDNIKKVLGETVKHEPTSGRRWDGLMLSSMWATQEGKGFYKDRRDGTLHRKGNGKPDKTKVLIVGLKRDNISKCWWHPVSLRYVEESAPYVGTIMESGDRCQDCAFDTICELPTGMAQGLFNSLWAMGFRPDSAAIKMAKTTALREASL